MGGLKVIFKKELQDHFTSYRFLIIFSLIWMVSLLITYMVGTSVRDELSGIAKPKYVFLLLFMSSGGLFSFIQFVAFFGPLIGIILGFDLINREKNEGTLSRILAQPIYRDAVINGKFLAGVVTISIMMTSIVLVITGLGLKVVGVVPGLDELLRIVMYLILSIVYISFWLGISILFSILFRSVTTSALAALAAWIFFTFFVPLGAGIIAKSFVPPSETEKTEAILKQLSIQRSISLASPVSLYSEAASTIIDPTKKTTRAYVLVGPFEKLSIERFSGPLPVSQSLLIVIPYIISIVAITAICFAVSYTVFLRQEIRSL
ncbi:MAG: ABC transporter permease [Desulfobacterota bacterium]|nr:ABC transporter permease [Thermodesulfobacteriota bacterium]MDW8001102.1 ABC transporter permease subunit [Deltaproteobacteria bacterium]